MKEILITGGTGNLGYKIASMFSPQKYKTTILARNKNVTLPKGVSLLKGDLTDNESIERSLKKFHIIIHCASNPRDSENVDYKGTINLLKAINSASVSHFIYISIVGTNKSDYPYYQNKHKVEGIIKESKIPYTIFRFTQFHDFVLERIITAFMDSNQTTFRAPKDMTFQSIDIKDAATIISDSVEVPRNKIVEIGGPKALDINEIINIYQKYTGKHIQIENPIDEHVFYKLFTSRINLCSNKMGTVNWESFVRDSI